tara:strand:- start:640 stop:2001 length:1362 start_codon:yes stop_codon:yes gene_type:complete
MVATLDVSIVLGYILIITLIGFWSARKQSPDAYMAHNRSLNTFSFITTVSASWIGGGAIVAYGAYIYEFGIAGLSVYIGVLLSMILFAYYVPRLREEGHAKQFLTMADYFFARFGRRAGFVATGILIVAIYLFLVNQFIAGSAVLSSIAGWSYEVALYVCGGVVMLYLLLGGMKSVVKTDIFQFLTMIVLLVVLGFSTVRGTGVDPQLLKLTNMSPMLTFSFILYGLFTPFASAEIWQRIYIAKNNVVARRGLVGAGICILTLGMAITLLALAAKTAYPGIDPSEAIPYGMKHLLPVGFLGMGLAVLFAAIMSSVDTLVFYLSLSFAKDCVGRVKNVNQQNLQRMTQFGVLIVTGVGVLGAFFMRDIIEVIITVAGITMGFIPPILASFHVQLKEHAVIASLISSCIYVAALSVLGLFVPELAMMSLFVSGIVLFVFQKFVRVPSREQSKEHI